MGRYGSSVEKTGYGFALEGEVYEALVSQILQADHNLDEETQCFQQAVAKYPQPVYSNTTDNLKLSLVRNPFKLALVRLRVNGQQRLVLLDTGAEVSVFTDKIVSNNTQVGQLDETIEVRTATNSLTQMKLGRLEELCIGNRMVENLPVLVVDERKLSLQLLGRRIIGVDGVVGWDVLRELDFELDYPRMEFRMIQEIGTQLHKNLLRTRFPVIVANNQAGALQAWGLDTGARKSWLNQKMVERDESITDKTKKTVTVKTINGKEQFDSLTISQYEIHLQQNRVCFSNIGTGYTGFLNGIDLDGVFGADVLRRNCLRVLNTKGLIEFV